LEQPPKARVASGAGRHHQDALKRRLGRIDQMRNFRLGQDLGQVQHLLRARRLCGAPTTLERLNIEERNAASRCATVFGASFQVRNIAAWYSRICSKPSWSGERWKYRE
jgi:hypothetical protein